MILFISVLSVVISPFPFLILLIWFYSFIYLFIYFSLMSLANGLSVSFIFSKNQILILFFFAKVSLFLFSHWNKMQRSCIFWKTYQPRRKSAWTWIWCLLTTRTSARHGMGGPQHPRGPKESPKDQQLFNYLNEKLCLQWKNPLIAWLNILLYSFFHLKLLNDSKF